MTDRDETPPGARPPALQSSAARSAGPPTSLSASMEEPIYWLDDARDCVRCGLSANRAQVVLPDGDPTSLIAVGEGPGAEEDAQGVGFVGASGRTLDREIEAVTGLSRPEYARANIVRCRPEKNRVPSSDERRACDPHLSAYLAAVKADAHRQGRVPPVLLAVGRTAIAHLLGQKAPEKTEMHRWLARWEYGDVFLPSYQGFLVVPMPHTSGLSWNQPYSTPEDESRAAEDESSSRPQKNGRAAELGRWALRFAWGRVQAHS